MKKQAYLLLPLLLLPLFAPAQQLEVSGVTALAADGKGACYVVQGSSVAKYSDGLELQARYANPFGQVESVDPLDPFKVVVFCRQLLRVLLLDNRLSLLGNPIFLPGVSALRPTAVCRAAGNGLWVADAFGQQLLYLDLTLNTTREAASLTTLTGNGQRPVTRMVERGGRLFVGFAGGELAVFDRFGALLRCYTLGADGWFDLRGSSLYYLRGQTLYVQNLLAWSTPPRPLAHGVALCALSDAALYLYRDGVLAKAFAE